MIPDQNTITRLTQANRRLKFGYLALAVVGLLAYTLSSPEPTQAVQTDRHASNAHVDVNKVGNAQSMVAIDNPDGYVVIIDEEGKINIVTRDGKVLIPKRKHYAN
jgi:hypothetical protein